MLKPSRALGLRVSTPLHGAHSPHQPLLASHRYCENAWDSDMSNDVAREGLGKSSTSLFN